VRSAGTAVGLSGIRISLEGANYRSTGVTDGAGQYEFKDLAPGEYKIGFQVDGYRLISPLTPVRLHAKGCANVALPLQLDRVVAGRVFTKAGMPAQGVTIEAVPTRGRDVNDLPLPADSATTDAEGRYELRGLQSGEYYLGTSIGTAPSKENPYPRWFHPGTERPEEAVPVHIYDKPQRQTFNLTLPDAQKTRIIEGVVLWPDGKPAVDAQIMFVDEGWAWRAPHRAARTDDSGRFTTEGLDGATYRVHALGFTDRGRFAEPVTIVPGSDRVQLRLMLTRTENTFLELGGEALQDWRLGRGLR
jgi:5-hydroxyisourate hydrolase-like protein (transthyretin family)